MSPEEVAWRSVDGSIQALQNHLKSFPATPRRTTVEAKLEQLATEQAVEKVADTPESSARLLPRVAAVLSTRSLDEVPELERAEVVQALVERLRILGKADLVVDSSPIINAPVSTAPAVEVRGSLSLTDGTDSMAVDSAWFVRPAEDVDLALPAAFRFAGPPPVAVAAHPVVRGTDVSSNLLLHGEGEQWSVHAASPSSRVRFEDRFAGLGFPDARPTLVLPFGPGSFWMLRGRVKGLWDGVVFEGRNSDPIVLAPVEGLGVVYIAGTGHVELPDGSLFTLPATSRRKSPLLATRLGHAPSPAANANKPLLQPDSDAGFGAANFTIRGPEPETHTVTLALPTGTREVTGVVNVPETFNVTSCLGFGNGSRIELDGTLRSIKSNALMVMARLVSNERFPLWTKVISRKHGDVIFAEDGEPQSGSLAIRPVYVEFETRSDKSENRKRVTFMAETSAGQMLDPASNLQRVTLGEARVVVEYSNTLLGSTVRAKFWMDPTSRQKRERK